MLNLLWNSFPLLWNDSHIIELLGFLSQRKTSFIEGFLRSKTTQKIFLNSTQTVKDQFFSLVRNSLVLPESVKHILNNDVYSSNESLSEEILDKIYDLIKDNEVDHLEQQLDSFQVRGIANIIFNNYLEDQEVLTLDNGTKISISVLNPVLLSIKRKSFACLKYLVENFDLRQSLIKLDLKLVNEHVGEIRFQSLVLAILLKIKDNEALSFLGR